MVSESAVFGKGGQVDTAGVVGFVFEEEVTEAVEKKKQKYVYYK